jgi:predicted nucleotidyltransferase
MQEGNLLESLRSLHDSGAEFILVGGLAAVLNGAPVNTYDVDVVFARTAENRARLLKWTADVNAIFRIQPERCFRPNESHLAAGRHMNLITRYGWIDLLGTIGDGLGYEELLPCSNEMDVGEGIRIRVLNLETIILVKEQLASEKDLAVLPLLRRTLVEVKRGRS